MDWGEAAFGLIVAASALITLITGKLPVARSGFRTTWGDRRDAPLLWWLLWSIHLFALWIIGSRIAQDHGYFLRLPWA